MKKHAKPNSAERVLSLLEEYRETLQLSQEQMAFYLGIGRSHLNMVERKERMLPFSALMKLVRLEQLATGHHIARPGDMMEHLQDLKDISFLKLGNRRKKVLFQIQKLDRELEEKKAKAQAFERKAKLLDFLDATNNTDEAFQIWLNLEKAKCKKQLSRYSPLVLANLDLQLKNARISLLHIHEHLVAESRKEKQAETTPKPTGVIRRLK